MTVYHNIKPRHFFFPPNTTTCPFVDFVVLRPGHGRSVTDFWGWDAHEAQLRCPDGVWVVIEEDVVPGGALNPNSTNLPRPWSTREFSPSRKIPTVEPGIEPGTSWLVVRDSWPLDHEAGHLIETTNVENCKSSSRVLLVSRDTSGQKRDGGKNGIFVGVKHIYKLSSSLHREFRSHLISTPTNAHI